MTSSPPPEPPTLRSFSTGAPPTRRSYSCYNCSHSFYITPATVSPPPTSFRCPRCYQRHLIPHHTVVVPPPPPPPPPPPVAVETYESSSSSAPGIFTYYTSDDFESDYEEYDSDSFSFPLPNNNNYHITASALQSLIDSLRVKSFFPKLSDQVQSCSICMDDFTIESKSTEPCEVVLELPCKHCFHRKCIKEWLSRSNTCPMCRYKLQIERLIETNCLPPVWPQYNNNDDLVEFQLDQPGTHEVINQVREPAAIRRVNAEVSLSAFAEAHASGSDWRVVSTSAAGRSRWFDPMHDEDGDTFMMDA